MSIWFKDYTLEILQGFRTKNLAQLMGISLTEVGPDFLRGTMPVDERTQQPFGILHGGASCVLSESLGSVAAWMCIDPEKYRAVGLEINANHIRAVTNGTVVGTCKPIHTGRRTHVWQTDIIVEETGKLVCTSKLTVAIIEIDSLAAQPRPIES